MTSQRRRQATTRRISDQWLQYIRGSGTESGANTFTQVSVALPVVVAEGFVIEAHLIEFEFPQVVPAEVQATDDILTHNCQLTKASQTALIPLNDPDLIYAAGKHYISPAARTAEKAPVFGEFHQGALNWQFPEPILLPFSEIFFAVNSTGSTLAKRYNFRIGYKTVRLTTRQLPELIQAVT